MCGWLTLVANGAMLSFVILHGNLKHIVAADADSMNFQRFLCRVLSPCGFIMRRCVRLAHWQILTCNANSTRARRTLRTLVPNLPNESSIYPCICDCVGRRQTGLLQFYD